MILCARSVQITWTEHETQITQREHVKGLFIMYSQNNKVVWLSNMVETFVYQIHKVILVVVRLWVRSFGPIPE